MFFTYILCTSFVWFGWRFLFPFLFTFSFFALCSSTSLRFSNCYCWFNACFTTRFVCCICVRVVMCIQQSLINKTNYRKHTERVLLLWISEKLVSLSLLFLWNLLCLIWFVAGAFGMFMLHFIEYGFNQVTDKKNWKATHKNVYVQKCFERIWIISGNPAGTVSKSKR